MDPSATGQRAPTVSVVLPTYDRVGLLRQAVTSVLDQSVGDWELIIADDGSTDGTRRYLEGLSDPRVHTLWMRHSGIRPSRGTPHSASPSTTASAPASRYHAG